MLFDTTLQTEVGYAASAFHWSMGSDAGPRIVSELQWKRLRGPCVSFFTKSAWNDFLFAFAALDGMWATSGYVTDSDFEGENRSNMSDRAICNASGSKQGSVRVGMGVSTCFYTVTFDVSCGYQAFAQRLKMYKGEMIESTHFVLGPIDGLSNQFNTLWQGFEGALVIKKNVGLLLASLDLSFSVPFYSARGHWNLRTDYLDPFPKQSATNAWGGTVRASLFYKFMGLAYQSQYFAAHKGKDMWSAVDGFGNLTTGAGRLNEAISTTSYYTIFTKFSF